LHGVGTPAIAAQLTSHFAPQRSVQSAPSAQVPTHLGVSSQSDVDSAPASTTKLQFALSLQVTSQVEPRTHVNRHVLLSSQVILHVRFRTQVKSQLWFCSHLQLFPQLTASPGAASDAGVVPEEEEVVDEEEPDEADVPVGVDETPPSPGFEATFQSYEQPKRSPTPQRAATVARRPGPTRGA